MTHITYLILNSITGKVYIGYTKYTLEKRWTQHCKRAMKTITNTPFYNAIRKYGTNVWICSILEKHETAMEAKIKEIEYIAKYGSYKNGYNATLGGDGNPGLVMSKESNKKRSEALKGIPKNYERMHGKKHTDDTLKKMRKPKANKDGYQTDYFKEKMRKVQAKAAKEKRVLNEDQYNQIFDYMSKGYSKRDIANILNISYHIVKKWSKKSW